MTLRWPRLLTPKHLSEIIREQKNPLQALRLFKEAENKYPNYRHNGPVYGTMINLLGSCGRITEMKEVIAKMKLDSCEVKDEVFAGVIRTYARAGLLEEAVALFKNLPHFNCVNWTESFNTLLELFLKESKLDVAHRLFLENSHGWEVKHRLGSLNLLMDALCRHNRSDLALHIFQEMNSQCCSPNRESYKILMKGLCQNRMLNEATHLLYSTFWKISQKGSGEDVTIYRILLNALCDNGQAKEAIEILGKILRKGLKAPNRCHRLLDNYTGCSPSEDIERVKGLINEALIKGSIPGLACYSAIAIDLYAEGQILEANQVFIEMQLKGFKPSHKMYQAKVAALCEAGRTEEAEDVIDQMLAMNIVPTVKIYNAVIRGLCDHGKSISAAKYLEKMAKQVGCVANEDTFDMLIQGLCREFKFIEASSVMEMMVAGSFRPSAERFDSLISGLCWTGRQYEGVMWLEEMVSRGEVPDVSLWHSLVSSNISIKCLDMSVRSLQF
uniref:Pentatricopeptide repeat-containing protein n=1 Tax=Kalanchoe fedtschenkoi TaxID=63787 RepID=A0A7N0T4H5_KALFE